MQIIPYLTFRGNCEEAFKRYAEVLGGKIVAMFNDRFGIPWMINCEAAK